MWSCRAHEGASPYKPIEGVLSTRMHTRACHMRAPLALQFHTCARVYALHTFQPLTHARASHTTQVHAAHVCILVHRSLLALRPYYDPSTTPLQKLQKLRFLLRRGVDIYVPITENVLITAPLRPPGCATCPLRPHCGPVVKLRANYGYYVPWWYT